MRIPEYRIIEKHINGCARYYPQFRRFWIWWDIYDGLWQTSLEKAHSLIKQHREELVSRYIPDKIYHIKPEEHILTILEDMEKMCKKAIEPPPEPRRITYLEQKWASKTRYTPISC